LLHSGKLNFSALRNLLTPVYGSLGVLLIALNLFLTSERWRTLIRTQGLRIASWPAMKLTLIGIFFNYAMPGGVGGDVIKAYYFNKDQPGEKVVAVSSVLMDRVLGLFAMVLMALVVMIFDFEHIEKIPTLMTLFVFISALSAGFVVGLALVFSAPVYRSGILTKILQKLPMSAKLLKLYESLHLYGKNGRSVMWAIVLSFLAQMSSILFLYLAGYCAGFTEIPLKVYCLVAPLGFMATAIPISPAGVGVGQAAFYFLFNLYTGSATELGPTTITALQVGTFLISLSGAYFYLLRKEKIPAQA
jgi:uncharacterized protein (TIRG00374 family)